ncbi:acylphosphatase [Thiobacter aerophilum]|uniref:Acylphosphatase n=1 Tax=Thiobacter aerophilum TaxID=3121275 RepID=A0ABV0EJY8_9BURK
MEKITRRLRIHGRVQGVFFRESMRQQALALGVTGWVRNCSDGSVEAVVHGTATAVAQLIAWARRGPELAQVEGMEVEAADGVFDDFRRLPSADCHPAMRRRAKD